MSEKRIIKKYPNRRLYDTAVSSYITLEDVKRLVLSNIEVQVLDARTQEDITHNTLLQIMVEQEEEGQPLFSNQALRAFIRFYGASRHQPVMSQLLEESALTVLDHQPEATVLTEAHLSEFRHLQEEWWRACHREPRPEGVES